jgi:hypothetical protein
MIYILLNGEFCRKERFSNSKYIFVKFIIVHLMNGSCPELLNCTEN